MRPSTSKSKGRKAKKLKLAPQSPTNFLDIPSDVMTDIFLRIGLIDMVENARKVCTTWCRICNDIFKDPAWWRVIYVDVPSHPRVRRTRGETCKYILDKSQGQLVDLTIVFSHDWRLLLHAAVRSRQLKRLVVACCPGYMIENWSELFPKFTLLEELSLYSSAITERDIEKAGMYCPLLKILKLNQTPHTYTSTYRDGINHVDDGIAIAIGENLPGLRHLELIGNDMSNYGLNMILNGCPHLESLDLRGCFYINYDAALKERLLQNIKNLKWPRDSRVGCPYIHKLCEHVFNHVYY